MDYATYRGNKVYRGPITLSLVGKETMNVNCPPVYPPNNTSPRDS